MDNIINVFVFITDAAVKFAGAFIPVKFFQASQIFASKATSYSLPDVQLSWLTRKYLTTPKKLGRDKHSSTFHVQYLRVRLHLIHCMMCSCHVLLANIWLGQKTWQGQMLQRISCQRLLRRLDWHQVWISWQPNRQPRSESCHSVQGCRHWKEI